MFHKKALSKTDVSKYMKFKNIHSSDKYKKFKTFKCIKI